MELHGERLKNNIYGVFMSEKKTLEEVISEAGRTSNEVIPKHIKIDISDEEHKNNI